MKKILSIFLVAALFVLTLMVPTLEAFAHGWIVEDRAHLSSEGGGFLNRNMGNVQWEPQSAGVL